MSLRIVQASRRTVSELGKLGGMDYNHPLAGKPYGLRITRNLMYLYTALTVAAGERTQRFRKNSRMTPSFPLSKA